MSKNNRYWMSFLGVFSLRLLSVFGMTIHGNKDKIIFLMNGIPHHPAIKHFR